MKLYSFTILTEKVRLISEETHYFLVRIIPFMSIYALNVAQNVDRRALKWPKVAHAGICDIFPQKVPDKFT